MNHLAYVLLIATGGTLCTVAIAIDVMIVVAIVELCVKKVNK